MESKLVTMAREMEKLRAELASAEKRARSAVVNPGTSPFKSIVVLIMFCVI